VTGRAWLRLVVVIVVTAVLQVGVLDGLEVHGAHPDGFLLVAIAAGLVAGPQRGAVIAFVVGLVADLFVLTPFGLSALVDVLVAFGVGSAAALPAGRAPYSFRMVMAFAGGITGTLLFAVISALLGQPKLSSHELVVVVAVVAIANVVLVVPAAAAMSWAVNVGPSRDLAAVSGGSAVR
jgi:rod shape-determining protein MreD